MSNIAEQEAEHGEEVPQRPASPISKPRWTTVQSSWFILYLVLVYSGLAIASWTIIAIQVYRPITASSYQHGAGVLLPAENLDPIFESNDNWYRFARVIQSIVSALTLPVTSAACARAAVIYAERLQPPEYGRDGNDLSVRQVAVLADKGWVDITAYAHILIGRWKLYGSKFLAFAMWVTILGLVIQPLQQIFLSTTTVRRASGAALIETVDIMDKFIDTLSRSYPHGRDNSRLVVTTRKLLEVTDLDEIQPMLWSGDNDNCTTAGSYLNGGIGVDNTCRHGGFNVWDISSIPNAFLAPLPSAFSTGMIPQAILRINSTAEVRSIATSEFPESCQRNGSYYVQYHNESLTDQISEQGFWSVEACMPVTANQDYRYSPWTPTRHRQDFVEHLYIRYTSNLNSEEGMSPRRLNVSSGHAVHIIANTTAGYFELPNYRNGQAPSPILDTGICARPNGTCLETYFPVPEVEPDATDKSAFGSPNVMGPGTPEDIPNKGPLLTIALALFGRGSMVESLMTAPQLYTRNISGSEAGDYYRTCLDKVPLANMFRKRTLGLSRDFQGMIGCLKVEGTDSAAPATLVENWLALFQADTSILSSVFTAASFLANRAWLLDLGESVAWSYTEYDHGADATKPDISLGGLVVISTLLAVQLLTLCLVAIYSCWYPRWTDTLDAFSMMRIGSALSDRIPLMMFRDILFVSALDEIPGRMGEAAGSGEIGKLELGGTQAIQGRKRRYECIDGLYDPSERHRE